MTKPNKRLVPGSSQVIRYMAAMAAPTPGGPPMEPRAVLVNVTNRDAYNDPGPADPVLLRDITVLYSESLGQADVRRATGSVRHLTLELPIDATGRATLQIVQDNGVTEAVAVELYGSFDIRGFAVRGRHDEDATSIRNRLNGHHLIERCGDCLLDYCRCAGRLLEVESAPIGWYVRHSTISPRGTLSRRWFPTRKRAMQEVKRIAAESPNG